MSRTVTAGEHTLRLVPADACDQYWVRRADTGRTLGTVYKHRSAWNWASSRVAFQGDGRPGLEADGRTDKVPEHLDGAGREKTQGDACAALIIYLEVNCAPAMGFGPHQDVRRQPCEPVSSLF